MSRNRTPVRTLSSEPLHEATAAKVVVQRDRRERKVVNEHNRFVLLNPFCKEAEDVGSSPAPPPTGARGQWPKHYESLFGVFPWWLIRNGWLPSKGLSVYVAISRQFVV